ncbi:MAG: hypothetical protein ACREMY_17325 [bacterium]
MDAKTARAHLTDVQAQLARNEDEHEVLVNLARGYEGWLRLNPDNSAAQPPQMSLTFQPEPANRSEPKGSRSFRGAILQVIKDARGEPISTREILPRALALGAITESKNPLGTVDLMVHSLTKIKHPVIEKVGPRLWRYTGPQESRDGAPM